MRKCASTALAVMLAALCAATGSRAQSDFPNRQIRLLVGFPAGGSTDVLSRVIAQEAGKTLGREIIIVNKAGAAGSVAINELITTPADGYTVATTPSSTLTIAPFFINVAPDQLEKTDALLMIGRQRAGIMINAESPIRSLKDFIAQARANPGKLSIGYIGPGTMGGIILRGLLAHEKLEVNLVPLNGDAPVTNAVLANHVTAGVGSAAAFSEHVRAGKMRLLASGEAERLEVAPDVPNLVEMGYPYKGNAIQYMLAPKGLPPAIRKKLIDAFLAATKTSIYVDMAKKNELFDPTEITGEALDKYLLEDRAEIGALVQKLGLAKK
jgi:tripartite-type tricarboxylate transporter receptor subunit TctC